MDKDPNRQRRKLGRDRFLILRGKWRRQYTVILGFFFFDYVSTARFCQNPEDEWNIVAKTFMVELNSIPVGMTVFFLMAGALWYLGICIVSRYANRVKARGGKSSYRIMQMCTFTVFAFVAAWDFGFGATSWFWSIPIFWRVSVGLAIYTAVYFLWIDKQTPAHKLEDN